MEFRNVRYKKRGRQTEKWKMAQNFYDAAAQFLFYSISAFWMELVYHVFTYGTSDISLQYLLLFSISIGGAFAFFTGLFPQAVNRILSVLFMVGLALFYCTEQVYRSLFKVPLMLNLAIGGAGDVTQYWREAIFQIGKNIPAILLIFAPVVILCLMLGRRQLFTRHRIRVSGVMLLLALASLVVPVGVVNLMGKESGIYLNYYELPDQTQAAKQMGILCTFLRDAEGIGRGGDDMSSLLKSEPKETNDSKSVNANTQKQKQDTSANAMEIDFDALSKKEKNKKIKILNEYFKNAVPTNKNRYTGMFAGKNLILITAESYSPWAVDEALTPTLYKLTHEGFVFDNFYTSLWQTSTSDGEYVALTGLIPDGAQSMKRAKKNSMPFTIAKQFNRFGIKSRAFHSNSLSYYDRYLTHTNLGYEFYAAKLGNLSGKYNKYLFHMEHANAWPNSDYDCARATYPMYSGDEIFHTYYLTLSGHCHYTFSGNSMAAKNKKLVQDLPYTEGAKAYIAQNIELDRALEYLITQLKVDGRLDQTVIALSADHYPYDLDKEDIESIEGKTVDETFGMYKNHFILWNSAMAQPVSISKACSSLDILPTLLNLFGFTYDSRLLAGKDILSDAEGLVVFNNKSFITDKVMYDNVTKKATYLVDKSSLEKGYLKKKIEQVKALFTASAGILDNDYYKYIEPYLKFPNYKETLCDKKIY